MVRRKPRTVVLRDRLLRGRRRFGLLALAGAAGLAVLALVVLAIPHWGEAGSERWAAIQTPPVASSPDAKPDEPPPAASAGAPALSSAPEQAAGREASGDQRDVSAPGATRAKPDPAPHTAGASPISPEGSVALTPQVQSRLRPPAPAAQSQPPASEASARVQPPESASSPVSASLPQPAPAPGTPAPARVTNETSSSPVAPAEADPSATSQATVEASSPDRPEEPASPARSQGAGGASAPADRPAPPAGEFRVFIHHVGGSGSAAAQAQRLAEHLRSRGFTVADIRPVDFSIGQPSVRYFFEDDRSGSERLVDELGRFLEEAGARAPERASDFTHFTPKPRPGNVEVWLPVS